VEKLKQVWIDYDALIAKRPMALAQVNESIANHTNNIAKAWFQKSSKEFKSLQKSSKVFKRVQKSSKVFKRVQKSSKEFKRISEVFATVCSHFYPAGCKVYSE